MILRLGKRGGIFPRLRSKASFVLRRTVCFTIQFGLRSFGCDSRCDRPYFSRPKSEYRCVQICATQLAEEHCADSAELLAAGYSEPGGDGSGYDVADNIDARPTDDWHVATFEWCEYKRIGNNWQVINDVYLLVKIWTSMWHVLLLYKRRAWVEHNKLHNNTKIG